MRRPALRGAGRFHLLVACLVGHPRGHAGLGGGQQFGQRRFVVAERPAQRQGGRQVEREAQASGDVPGLPALLAQWAVLFVGTEAPPLPRLTLRARRPVLVAPGAVVGPAAPVPSGAGPDAFFSASPATAEAI